MCLVIDKSDLHIIGAGGNNKVYRYNKSYKGQPAVVRIPKQISSFADDTISKWQLIRSAGLPTLSFVEKCVADGRECLICEDVSAGDIVYISPRSVLTERQRAVNRISDLLGFPSMKDYVENTAEQICYENKIVEFLHFNDFLARVKEALVTAYDCMIYLPFDCWFFCLQKGAHSSTLDFKFVDLDNVERVDIENMSELKKANQDDFMENIESLLNNFVTDINRAEYLGALREFDFSF